MRHATAIPSRYDATGKENTKARFVRHGWEICLLALTGASLVGCFDAEAMILSRHEIAIRSQLEEVDLGEFHASLPQTTEGAVAPEIYFHIFGQVTNRDLDTVKSTLDKYKPEIRHRLLLTIRLLTAEEIEDPMLLALRTNITNIVNETFPDKPFRSVGFYSLTLSNL